jgi:hypothetical protein
MRKMVFFATLSVASAAIAATPYSVIELQARSNIVDGFNLPAASSFNSKTPALNESREIAFSLIVVGGANPGLFVGLGGVGSVVYSGPSGRVLSDPSINAEGFVAFDQSDLFSEGIFVFDPVTLDTLLTVPADSFDFTAGQDITDDGRIGFRAGDSGGSRSWQMFDDGTLTTFATEGGNVAYLFTASTNNMHRIGGKVRLNHTGGNAPDEIRVYDGPGSFSVVAEDVDADIGSPYASFDNSPYLTDDGRVAFIADTVSGDRGVYLTDGTTTVAIATEADPQVSGISFFSASSSNGLVAFRGTDGAGLDAIFVGDGATLYRAVGEHDLVETDLGTARIDQHDSSVVFGGAVGINARGDIAFNAALTPEDDNQIEWGSGMFVAFANSSPPPVPDGWFIGDPMTVARSGFGNALVIRWDSSTCPADDTNLFFGDLSEVSSGTVSSARCSLGAAGPALVVPPAGDVFFLLASENTTGVESGHGVDSNGVPRPFSGVGHCDVLEQSLEGVCR